MVLTLKAIIRTHPAMAGTGAVANSAHPTLEQPLKVNYIPQIYRTQHKIFQQHMREEIIKNAFNMNYSLFI